MLCIFKNMTSITVDNVCLKAGPKSATVISCTKYKIHHLQDRCEKNISDKKIEDKRKL